MPPDGALRAWMERYVEYMATKRGMAEALRAVIASGGNPYAESRTRLTAAIVPLQEAGAAAGTIRPDVAPADILTRLGALALDPPEPAQRDRLLDPLVAGMRSP